MAVLLNRNALPNMSKLEPLDGANYKRWSQRLLIVFEQLEVDYVLFNETPTISFEGNNEAVETTMKAVENYQKHNKLVRGHLLNHLPNNLFDLFVSNKSAKSIWETLEKEVWC